MNRRIALEIALGLMIAGVFFWWLYLRPEQAAPALGPGSEKIRQSMAKNSNKVLVIGVDAMDWDVAMDLINQGLMPNLETLVRKGAHGELISEPPLISPAIWTTFATGVDRKTHGIVNFTAKLPFQYREVRMTSRFRKVPALWNMASWAGRSAAVINWNAAAPAEELFSGVFVAEEVVPGEVFESQVWPREWAEKVRTAPLPSIAFYQAGMKRVKDQRLKTAYDYDRAAFSAALEIMRQKRPDLVMVYLRQTDVLSHGFWKYSRPLGLDYGFEVSRPEIERNGGVIELHYRLVDRLIGGLLSQAEGYTVFVISDHGHGPTYPPKNIFADLNRLLEELGELHYVGATCEGLLKDMKKTGVLSADKTRPDQVFQACSRLRAAAAESLARESRKLSAREIEEILSGRFTMREPPDEGAARDFAAGLARLAEVVVPKAERQQIYWPGTEAWNVEDFHKLVRGIYLNLEEREPEGVVPRERYYEKRGELADLLRGLRTDAGNRLFSMVRENKDKEVMPMGEADPPDILVRVNRQALLDKYAMRKYNDPDPLPLAAVRWSYSDVSGDHTKEGVLVISGPHSYRFKRIDAYIYDICPTILWHMGMPVGKDMPGRVLREAFDGPEAKKEILYVNSWTEIISGKVESEPIELTPGQRRQFRDIGYIK